MRQAIEIMNIIHKAIHENPDALPYFNIYKALTDDITAVRYILSRMQDTRGVLDFAQRHKEGFDAIMTLQMEALGDKHESEYKAYIEEMEVQEALNAPHPVKVAMERRRMTTALPYVWNDTIENKVLNYFDNSCALTGVKDDLVFDHFIPVSWGHGGAYEGNLIPLNRKHNSIKRDKNPFHVLADELDTERGERLIAYLSELHAVSPDEYRSYVCWCEDNKRNRATGIEYSTFKMWQAIK